MKTTIDNIKSKGPRAGRDHCRGRDAGRVRRLLGDDHEPQRVGRGARPRLRSTHEDDDRKPQDESRQPGDRHGRSRGALRGGRRNQAPQPQRDDLRRSCLGRSRCNRTTEAPVNGASAAPGPRVKVSRQPPLATRTVWASLRVQRRRVRAATSSSRSGLPDGRCARFESETGPESAAVVAALLLLGETAADAGRRPRHRRGRARGALAERFPPAGAPAAPPPSLRRARTRSLPRRQLHRGRGAVPRRYRRGRALRGRRVPGRAPERVGDVQVRRPVRGGRGRLPPCSRHRRERSERERSRPCHAAPQPRRVGPRQRQLRRSRGAGAARSWSGSRVSARRRPPDRRG